MFIIEIYIEIRGANTLINKETYDQNNMQGKFNYSKTFYQYL
jgi:hypothetical protein